jgi:hypothetical protein
VGERLAFFWFRFRIPLLGALVVCAIAAAGAVGYLSAPTSEPLAVVTGTVQTTGDSVSLADCLGPVTKGTQEYNVALGRCAATPFAFPMPLVFPGATGYPTVLTKRSGAWSFRSSEPVPVEALTESSNLQFSSASAVADLDNDGYPELIFGQGSGIGPARRAFFHSSGALSVLSGVSDGEDTSGVRGLPVEGVFEVTSIAPGDWDADGWVDLAVSSAAPAATASAPQLRLLRNRGWAGPGLFEDVTVTSGAQAALEAVFSDLGNVGPSAGGVPLEQVVVADFDGDRHVDLLVLSQFGRAGLLWGDGAGRFDAFDVFEVPRGARAVVAADVDRDGLLDLVFAVASPATAEFCLLNRPCEPPTTGSALLLGRPGRQFAEPTFVLPPVGSATSVQAVDIDNNGWFDLVFGVEPELDSLEELISAANGHNLVVLKPRVNNGTLVGFSPARLTGDPVAPVNVLMAADLDGDGSQDLVAGSFTAGGVLVWRNSGAPGTFLQVELIGAAGFTGPGSSRDGFGARVQVTTDRGTWTQQLGPQTSARHTASAPVLHFGLGDSTEVRTVTVTWSNGRRSVLSNVVPGQLVRISERPG